MSNGHIRRRGEGSWELKWDIGRDPATGKRQTRYETVKGTKRDANRRLRAVLQSLDEGTYIEPSKLTLGGYLDEWLGRQSVSGTTLDGYTLIVEKHLKPGLGAHALPKLQPIHIQRYMDEKLADGLSAQTVRHHERVLNKALKDAVKLLLIARNPVEAVEAPRVERAEIEFLDDDEAKALLEAAKSTRLCVPIALALATGMRRGELLGLRWRDVDMDKGKLHVVQSLEQTSKGLAFKGPKTKRSRRTIALPSSAVELLKAHKKAQAEERVFFGLGKRPADALVFTRQDGEKVNPRNFSKEFSRVAKRAGVKVSLHGLRHTHITNLLKAGVHPKIASERAGHSSVAVTMDVYSHALPGLQEDAASRIDAALRGVLSD